MEQTKKGKKHRKAKKGEHALRDFCCCWDDLPTELVLVIISSLVHERFKNNDMGALQDLKRLSVVSSALYALCCSDELWLSVVSAHPTWSLNVLPFPPSTTYASQHT